MKLVPTAPPATATPEAAAAVALPNSSLIVLHDLTTHPSIGDASSATAQALALTQISDPGETTNLFRLPGIRGDGEVPSQPPPASEPFFTENLGYGSLEEHGLPPPPLTEDGHRMIKITLQGNATKFTPEQVKTNLIIMSDKLQKSPGDIVVHGRPTGPWTVWLSAELAEELIIDKEIDMFDTGEDASFLTFYVRPLDLHGDELPRETQPEDSAEYNARKEERDNTKAQKREAEKDRTVRFFVDAPKASMAFPDANMMDSIKENALTTNGQKIDRVNVINALDEFGERSTTYVVFILVKEGAQLDFSKLKYSGATIRGRFQLVKARFAKKDLPDVKPCCWSPRCAGPGLCTGHSDARSRLMTPLPQWDARSEQGSHMSRSEIRSAAGQELKTSQLEKAASLAALRPKGGLPPCARWWEGDPPLARPTHTDPPRTRRHTNGTHTRHRVVRPAPGLHSYARYQGRFGRKRHHMRLGFRILELALPIHGRHMPSRRPCAEVATLSKRQGRAAGQQTQTARQTHTGLPTTAPEAVARRPRAPEHTTHAQTLHTRPDRTSENPSICRPSGPETRHATDRKVHETSDDTTHTQHRPTHTLNTLQEPSTRRPPSPRARLTPEPGRKVRDTRRKRDIAREPKRKNISFVLQCKWSHLHGHILAPSRLPRWVHQSVT